MSDQINSPRFPARPSLPGQISEPYTAAELRMIHYVNSVVRGSDKPGTELREALSCIESLAAYWEHKQQDVCSELDERTDPKDAPKPAAPIAPANPGLPLCKNPAPPNSCSETSQADCCNCGG